MLIGSDATFNTIERRITFDPRFADLSPSLSTLVAILQRTTTSEGPGAFLDVETTGLGLGAGTLVILVGVAFVDARGLTVRQFFLADPAGERGMLEAIANLLARFDHLFTFNGKRFDVPMLTGRFRMHRLATPLPALHIDLLHPARQIWRRRLGRGNLATLEAQVLGIIRENDIPSGDVPSRYFAYLHEGRRDAIEPVLAHNRQDVTTLAFLAGFMGRLLESHDLARQSEPSDLLGLGRLLEASGQAGRARLYYEWALVGASPSERADALFRLASLARRANDNERAIQLFDAVSCYSSKRAALAAIELAKLYEHRIRQPERALIYARRALGLPGCALEDDLARRIARLEWKISRAPRHQ